MNRTVVAVSATVTAVVAFAVGFGFAVGGDDDGVDEVAVVATTTSPATVTVPPSSTVTVAPTTTPPTTSPPASTTVVEPPTTDQPVVVTAPPVTAAPARLTVQYNRDSADRLVMSTGGTALLTITNVGGSLGQWLVQASGYVYVVGVANGTLQPGQSVQVRLRGAPEVPAISPQGSVTVSGGADGQLTISVLVL
jgi:hypothetical protein